MKILLAGTPPAAPARRWWEGLKATCPTCGAQLELELDDLATDRVQETAQPGGKAWVLFICPTEGCGTQLDIERDRPAFGEVEWRQREAAIIAEKTLPEPPSA